MPVLLVDDRDGRIVAELESHDEELDSRHGAVVGMDTSIKIRPLPH